MQHMALYLQQRDRDVIWGIYRNQPLTTRAIAKAAFNGNENAASRRLKQLREAGYVISRSEHRPPKTEGSWRAGGLFPMRHEVTLKALREICPYHGEPIPSKWEPRL